MIREPTRVCGISGCTKIYSNGKWVEVNLIYFQKVIKKGAIAVLCDEHDKLRQKVRELAETI